MIYRVGKNNDTKADEGEDDLEYWYIRIKTRDINYWVNMICLTGESWVRRFGLIIFLLSMEQGTGETKKNKPDSGLDRPCFREHGEIMI